MRNNLSNLEAYLERCQTSKTEGLVRIIFFFVKHFVKIEGAIKIDLVAMQTYSF